MTPPERAALILRGLAASVNGNGRCETGLNGKVSPHPVPVAERVRRLPEALLLTAGYYASRAPVLGDLLRRQR
ncbi:MAG: hypothetical protein ACJ75Z_02135 [Solirubrobacterales bacterium]